MNDIECFACFVNSNDLRSKDSVLLRLVIYMDFVCKVANAC